MYNYINYLSEGGVGRLSINRPEALNALNKSVFKEMNLCLNEIEADKSLRVLVVEGKGKAFVAGADIAQMQHLSPAEGAAFSRDGQLTFQRIADLPFPVIAAINGFALGGGLELAMACDFRIASEAAKFGQPEVSLGLIPGFGGTIRLSGIVGLPNAIWLLTTGEMIGAQEALRIGLVQKLFASEAFEEGVNTTIRMILQRGALAVKQAKKVAVEGNRMEAEQGMMLESDAFGSLFGQETEALEGMTAFLEKRKPNWK
ncbi:MAG TPA: hypothetical protein DEO70_13360 [Bacteroidales bacterium]|nr:MAG: hypothetical protein A2X11_09145 [Bacteroidetes bacterium GWE2_42_24]PKP24317.1 MAG: hypothetical protein CVU06_05050 [Bacteroidetes bacterium HGW-Bacteroidetes-22]HBZ67816.1 hypothetical protein [Bacteroidales bacterium]